MDASERHMRRLTETSAAVNSTLDLEEVLHLVAEKVAAALEADACFVYLYDEAAGGPAPRGARGTPPAPEAECESILAVPIVARDQPAGALNVRTRAPREYRQDEVELLEAIAS